MEWYGAAVGLVIASGVWCIFRVRAEYLRAPTLSRLTVAAVWVLYIAHFAITLAAAATSRWPVPVNLASARIAGILLLGGGIVSFRSFRRMSGLDISTLVTTGVYRWSRNPQNVGWAFFLAGIAVAGRSAFALLIAVLFWVTFQVYVTAEEEFLERAFGEAYREYRASSHRYLGPPRKPGGDARHRTRAPFGSR